MFNVFRNTSFKNSNIFGYPPISRLKRFSVCVCVCLCVYVFVCGVCVYVCVYVCVFVCIHARGRNLYPIDTKFSTLVGLV